MNEIKEYKETLFEDIKHIDENGKEYWYARELEKVLEYKQWRRFTYTRQEFKKLEKDTKNLKE